MYMLCSRESCDTPNSFEFENLRIRQNVEIYTLHVSRVIKVRANK